MQIKFKRILSSIIDVVVMLILFFICLSAYNLVAVHTNSKYIEYATKMNNILLDSGLYLEKEDKVIEISSLYDEKLTAFYQKKYDGEHTFPYVDATKKYTSYEDAKASCGLFDLLENGTYSTKMDAEKEDVIEFFKDEMYKAKVSLFNYSDYHIYYDYIKKMSDIGHYGCLIFANIIVYLCVPLFIGRGRTLGKFICKYEVVSQDGSPASKVQILVRFIAWLMIGVLMFEFFYTIPLTINAIVFLLFKKHRTIFDMLAVTDVKEINYEEERR